jgi:hypothetical protein
MRNHLWDMVTFIRYTEYYCREYRKYYRRLNNRIIYACIGITIISLALMTIFTQLVILLAVLGVTGQAVQIVIPLLPYSKRIDSANYYILCARRLADDAEYKWNLWDISSEENDELAISIIDELNRAMTILDNDCFPHDDLPKKDFIEARAFKAWTKYLE